MRAIEDEKPTAKSGLPLGFGFSVKGLLGGGGSTISGGSFFGGGGGLVGVGGVTGLGTALGGGVPSDNVCGFSNIFSISLAS